MKTIQAFVLSRLALATLVFLFSLFTLTFAKPVHAQECAQQDNLPVREAIDKINKCSIEKDIFDDKIFNLNQITGTTDSLYNLLLGKSLLHPETDNITAGSGAVAASGKLVAILYAVPPASGVQYFANQIQRFNPVQPAYAQEGVGFSLLSPVQRIWGGFRNASYVGFVIVFVIMGFMIMFRAHISPQAVATVQDSIPRIVIALILVTFSYALAGLMIDVMFLFLNIAINILKPMGLNYPNIIFEKSIFGVIFDSWKDIFTSVSDAVANILDQVITLGVLDKIIGFLGGTVIGIIAGIAMLFVMVRVFLILLMAYVMIIILTMFAPFFFLIQALPGNNGAKEWFKQMAANVSVFPTVALMIIFAGMLGGMESLGGSGATEFTATQIGQFPLLSGLIKADAIGKLIALGFLLMTPEAANMVKKFVSGPGGGGGGFGAGAAIGAGLAAGAAPVGAFGRGAGRSLWERSPFGRALATGAAMRGERAQLEAREKIFQKPERIGMTSETLKKRGIGYEP